MTSNKCYVCEDGGRIWVMEFTNPKNPEERYCMTVVLSPGEVLNRTRAWFALSYARLRFRNTLKVMGWV